jgi:hypothetical protein
MIVEGDKSHFFTKNAKVLHSWAENTPSIEAGSMTSLMLKKKRKVSHGLD